ncbi:MAG TPA: PAS domain-containing protein [Candidatus Cybelea sp.]|nr:PAS domain-containing protein [Candidatus Cybelea sp.]
MRVELSQAERLPRNQGSRDQSLRLRAGPRRGSGDDIKVDSIELPLDAEIGAELKRALDYWQAKRGDRLAPARIDIEPLDLAPLLPRVTLVDVSAEPLDFRYRLAGTGIFDIHGAELTNTRACDLKPVPYGALIHRHYAEAVERKAPLAHRLLLEVGGLRSSYLRIILPLSDDGGVINRLMTVESYQEDAQSLQDCFAEVRTRCDGRA